ncbi:hypothetical protein [Microbacterium sp.]|uniref:hypothetical protein n=1 Tax=Microbacterium sp. TaxID=51671 RepID=UPI0039E28A4E
MVAHLLRLRLSLLLGGFRGDRRRVTRAVAALLVTAVVVSAACVGLQRLAAAPAGVATAAVVLGGTAVTLGFALVPAVSGAEDPLDPRRFAVLAVAPRRLAAGLLPASLVSVPALALVAGGVAVALLRVSHGASPWLAGSGAALGVVTCLLWGRVSAAFSSLVLRERRSRELTGLLWAALIVFAVSAALFLLLPVWPGRPPQRVTAVIDVLALTPFGAAWSVPDSGAGALVAALLVVAALVLAWFRLVDLLLTTVERPASARTRRGRGWFALTPATQGGAIAARSLVVWSHDPRYLANLVVVPVAAVVAVVPLVVVGVPLSTAALLCAPMLCLFLGWIPHNDLAYDSTALWIQLAGGVRGTVDRWGRLVPPALVAVALLGVLVPITSWLHRDGAIAPALVGVSLCLLLCGFGLSSVSSVLAPYAVTPPGENPFRQPQRTGGSFAAAGVLLGALVLSAPVVWWGWLSVERPGQFAWLTLSLGLGIGLLVCGAGIAVGGRVFDRHGSRLMEFAESA